MGSTRKGAAKVQGSGLIRIIGIAITTAKGYDK